MRRLLSKSDLQTLGFALAIVVLAASLPFAAGVVILSGHNEPELTVNTCQPLQTFNLTLNTLLAAPAPAVPEFVLLDLGSSGDAAPARLVDHRATPDTPPPKLV
jgi:hypothetical protein